MNEVMNFDMQQLTNLIGQNAQIVQSLLLQFGDVAKRVENLNDGLQKIEVSVNSKMDNFQNELSDLKENTEIDTLQRMQIRNHVGTRVYMLLGLPDNRKDWEDFHYSLSKKYCKIFFSRCYAEVARMGHLCTPYGLTPKRNYEYAIKDIDAWIPRGGVESLKIEADKLRNAI